MMIRALLEDIEHLIAGHGNAVILKDRVASLREHIERLEKEVPSLKTENGKLKDEIARLRRELEQATGLEVFTRHRGVLFRRLANGKYEATVYCPACKTPMFSLMGLPFRCSGCRLSCSFNERALLKIMSELSS